jgi:hypothetical protein
MQKQAHMQHLMNSSDQALSNATVSEVIMQQITDAIALRIKYNFLHFSTIFSK